MVMYQKFGDSWFVVPELILMWVVGNHTAKYVVHLPMFRDEKTIAINPCRQEHCGFTQTLHK